MTKYEYIEALNALCLAHSQKKLNHDFWAVIDLLPSKFVIEFNEELFKTRKLLGNDYLLIVGIQNQYKSTHSISKKQKRTSVLYQIHNWDDISLLSELF